MIQTATRPRPNPLETLVQEHSVGIFRYLRSVVGDEDNARDLVQDTFLKLRHSAEGAGRALVYTVARSCALDHLRRQRTRHRHLNSAEPDLIQFQPGKAQDRPDIAWEAGNLRRDLLAALGKLPEDQRTVFHLSEIEGLSYAEIAGILGVSPGTIASRKHHAVRKLRDNLRRLGHGA